MTVITITPGRVPAGGAMWRMRSLIAMGHSAARQARALGITRQHAMRLINGDMETISSGLFKDICVLWDAWWDKKPRLLGKHDGSAARAEQMARRRRWPCPAGLDEDFLDEVGYRPRHPWKHATGTGWAEEWPLGNRGEAA